MKKLSILALLLFTVSFVFSQNIPKGYSEKQNTNNPANKFDYPNIPTGRVLQTNIEEQYSFALESKDPGHQTPHPVSNIIFFDSFSSDKGWTGYEDGFWERDVAQIDEQWNSSRPEFLMPDDDFSLSADSIILGYNIGACHVMGENTPVKTITSPVIDCLWDSLVFLSFRSFSCYQSTDFNVQVFDGFDWHTVWDKWQLWNFSAFSIYSDNQWVYQEFDVSEYAANNEFFQIRFVFKPYTDGNFPGINIDDVTVFSPEQYDIGIIDINPHYDVSLQDSIIPSIRVQNFGYDIITSFEAVYTIDDASGGQVYFETLTYSGILQPSEDTLIHFPGILLSQQGNYTTNAEITTENENITENNSTSESFFANEHTFWSDNFSTEKGWSNYDPDYWERGEAIRSDDITFQSAINCFAPAYDLTQNGDNFLMADNIGNLYSGQINPHYVYSPEIDCSGKTNVILGFAAYCSIESMGKLKLEVRQENGSWAAPSWIIYPFFYDYYQYDWSYYTVDISEYADNNSNLEFRVSQEILINQYFGASFDNFSLSSNFDYDLTTTDFMPKGSFTGDTIYPLATVKNSGVQSIGNFSVDYMIFDVNGNTIFQSTDDFNQTIASGDIYDAKSPNFWIPEIAGTYLLKTWVSNQDDEYPVNDTLESEIKITEPNYGESKIYTYLATGTNDHNTAVISLDCNNSQLGILKSQAKIGDDFFSAADFINGALFSFRAFTQTLFIVFPNGETYEYLNVAGLENGVIGFGYNEFDNKIYYLAIGTTDYKLYRQTLGDGNLELVMNIPANYQYSSFAINSSGDIYATANNPPNNGYLLKIDYQNNIIKLIGNIKRKLKFSQGLGFDKQSDILYGTLFEEVGGGSNPFFARVYQIDTATAELYPLSNYYPGNEQMSYCSFSSDNEDYGINFTITENGNPVYGDTVFINNQELITNINGNVALPLKSGVYKYTVSSSCGETITDILCFFSQQPDDIVVDFDCTTYVNEQIEGYIQLYPNPSDDFINVISNKPAELTIIDYQGRLILKKQLGSQINKIDVSGFFAGIYLFKIKSGSTYVLRKVIIK